MRNRFLVTHITTFALNALHWEFVFLWLISLGTINHFLLTLIFAVIVVAEIRRCYKMVHRDETADEDIRDHVLKMQTLDLLMMLYERDDIVDVQLDENYIIQ